jgi:hypothetical protein
MDGPDAMDVVTSVVTLTGRGCSSREWALSCDRCRVRSPVMAGARNGCCRDGTGAGLGLTPTLAVVQLDSALPVK